MLAVDRAAGHWSTSASPGCGASTRLAYIDRVVAAIGRWQRDGLADQDVDAERLAAALGAMAERMAYLGCVYHDGPTDIDEMLAVSNHVWASALGLEQRTPSRA